MNGEVLSIIFFVIALVSTIASVYFYQKGLVRGGEEQMGIALRQINMLKTGHFEPLGPSESNSLKAVFLYKWPSREDNNEAKATTGS